MGLDIFLRKFTKPSLDTTKTYTVAELEDKNLSHIGIDENTIEKRLPQDIIDNHCQIVTVIEEHIDPEKLLPYFKEKYPKVYENATENHIDPCVIAFVPGEEDTVTIKDYNNTTDDEHPSITITSQNQQFNITKPVHTKAYVYQTEDVAYQRKGLNDYGWSLLPENCSYSTNYNNLVKLVTDGGLSKDFLDNWIEGETAYLAWW